MLRLGFGSSPMKKWVSRVPVWTILSPTPKLGFSYLKKIAASAESSVETFLMVNFGLVRVVNSRIRRADKNIFMDNIRVGSRFFMFENFMKKNEANWKWI